MYIWILLATIMIGLSFFNLSPRPDKDNAYIETKASTIVTRFKLENMALVRFLQCETLLRLHTNGWDSSSPAKYRFSVDSDDSNYKSFDYGTITMKPEDSLPIGYQANAAVLDEGQKMHHYLYCMDRPLEESGASVLQECRYGSTEYPTYMVSFAQIPARWLSKDGNNTPLPAFLGYLSDETNFKGVAGYTKCSASSCVLIGATAQKANVQENRSEIVYSQIAADSPIWNDSDFRETCKNSKPCMFMYKMMPTTDERAICRQIIQPEN